VIGVIDVGGSKLAAATAVDRQLGHVLREPTPAGDPAGSLIRLLERAARGEPLSAIGAAVPGPFRRDGGSLVNPPGMPRAWWGLGVKDILSAHFGCPAAVENDADCAALAEATEGAGRGAGTVVYVTVSTGIGTGVVQQGRLMTGRHDSEGGHQVLWPEWAGGPRCHCGGAGCLEALASGWAIEARFGRRAEHLDDQAAWDDVGRWLGLGVANITALLDPDVVVFGGGVTRSWARFAPALEAAVADHVKLSTPPRISLGNLPEERRTLLGAVKLISG